MAPRSKAILRATLSDRDVIVFLPPSYATNKNQRYPVVYALHGYSIGAEQWSKEIHIRRPSRARSRKGAQEMIVVLPDSKTVHNGSMYSSSVTTGDFEKYVARDVVPYMDSHYRTIPKRTSRGLVGHSMGGYGASRIGMKHSDVFGSLYIMSPCCMAPRGAGTAPIPRQRKRSKRSSRAADSAKLPTSACARSLPRPLHGHRIRRTRRSISTCPQGRRPQQSVLNRWIANAPLVFVHQYIGNLKPVSRRSRLTSAIRTAYAWTPKELHEILDTYGIANTFEIYPGTHTSAVAVRFQNFVMPFFSKNLCAGTACQ